MTTLRKKPVIGVGQRVGVGVSGIPTQKMKVPKIKRDVGYIISKNLVVKKKDETNA